MSKKDTKPEPEETQGKISKGNMLSWAVFVPTAIIVLLSVSSVVFPALLTRSTSPFQGIVATPEFVNPFQPGILAIPFVAINLILLGIGITYRKKKECKYRPIISRLTNFEVSKRQALIGIIILVTIFSAITAGTLSKEETWVDYKSVKDRVQTWTISDFTHGFEPHVRYLLLSASLHIFGNIRIIPFLTSIALLLVTYFFTKNITQKRFAGLVSTAVLLQSQIFIGYSTTASYDNSWILFYLFGLYLVQKFWPPSPVSFILSVFSKALTVAFLPMTLYFIARSTIPKRSKIISLASYGLVILAMIAGMSYLKTGTTDLASVGGNEFWQGFSAMAMQMRFDYIIVLFLLPLTVMLFFASRKGILHADSILICIISILLVSPLLTTFTDQTNQPYRFVSLSVFFAIGVGVLLSKRTRKKDELLSKKQ
ncbi:MAG: glycosyltransferase family protein [Nitrosotalea sp.]